MKNDLTKFADIYKECIIMGSIDPDETNGKTNNKKFLQLEEKDNLLLESHGFALTTIDKEIVAKESWTLFEILYEYIGGYKSYSSVADMVETCAFIKFIYKGPLNNIQDFDINKCLAVGTYNRKAGIKMTSIATNFICFSKQFALAAARKLQRDSLKFSWCEVSGKAESFLINQCGAMNYLIDPNIIKQIYPNIYVDIEDNTHYTRILTDSGISVRKIAFGTING
jgi:hypothetical protein